MNVLPRPSHWACDTEFLAEITISISACRGEWEEALMIQFLHQTFQPASNTTE